MIVLMNIGKYEEKILVWIAISSMACSENQIMKYIDICVVMKF
jgi:hypothetical protein